MKREWILGLATAAGMSLLTALPIFGSDKAVSNIKKPSTDASKPVVIASQQPVKGTNLSAKTINPTTDVKKTTEKKNTEKKSETVGKVTSSATVNAKPAVHGGITALQGAAISGDIMLAKLLLNKGADVNAAPSFIEGRYAIEGAAEHGRLDMVQLLLNAGARRIAGFYRMLPPNLHRQPDARLLLF